MKAICRKPHSWCLQASVRWKSRVRREHLWHFDMEGEGGRGEDETLPGEAWVLCTPASTFCWTHMVAPACRPEGGWAPGRWQHVEEETCSLALFHLLMHPQKSFGSVPCPAFFTGSAAYNAAQSHLAHRCCYYFSILQGWPFDFMAVRKVAVMQRFTCHLLFTWDFYHSPFQQQSVGAKVNWFRGAMINRVSIEIGKYYLIIFANILTNQELNHHWFVFCALSIWQNEMFWYKGVLIKSFD